MANMIYHQFLLRMAGAGGAGAWAWPSLPIVAALERDPGSTYTPQKSHDYFGDLAGLGFVELTSVLTPSYARQEITGVRTVTEDAAGGGRVELSFPNINFGNLEAGTVTGLPIKAKSIVLFEKVGDLTTLTDDPLIAYIDTASGLPATLGGGPFTVTLNVEGLIWLRQP